MWAQRTTIGIGSFLLNLTDYNRRSLSIIRRNENTINHRKSTYKILEKCYFYTIISLEKCKKVEIFILEKCILFAFLCLYLSKLLYLCTHKYKLI